MHHSVAVWPGDQGQVGMWRTEPLPALDRAGPVTAADLCDKSWCEIASIDVHRGPLVLERGCWSPRNLVATASVAPSYCARLRARVTNDLGPLIDDVLLDGELVSSGFLRRPPLRYLVPDQRSGRRDQSSSTMAVALFCGCGYRGALAAGSRHRERVAVATNAWG
jgi:hypothetical protein